MSMFPQPISIKLFLFGKSFDVLLPFSPTRALTKDHKNTIWANATVCKSTRLLVSPQTSLCKRNLDVMSAVVESTTVTFDTCQEQFQDRRWNCSSIVSAPNFTPDLDKGKLLWVLS